MIEISDLDDLGRGKPPQNDKLLRQMTVGREVWVNYIHDRYLRNYIAKGGSKVKLLVGAKGTGKTHLLRVVLDDAKKISYLTAYLSARDVKISDLVGLYQYTAGQIVGEHLVGGLCRQIARQISPDTDYDGASVFSPFIYADFPEPNMADGKIRQTIGQFFRDTDLSPSFKAFGWAVANSRMLNQSATSIEIACDWLQGKDVDRRAREALFLYEKLSKPNARDWLNSLVLICKLAGYKGLVIAIDDLEVILEKNNSNRYIYTKNQARDICELVRQLIDDTESLRGCLFLLSGRRAIIQDDNRSFRSYDALWARLQIGLADYGRFNPFADLVDVDKHLASQDRFLIRIFDHLKKIVANSEVDFTPPDDYRTMTSELQQVVIDAVCSKGGKL